MSKTLEEIAFEKAKEGTKYQPFISNIHNNIHCRGFEKGYVEGFNDCKKEVENWNCIEDIIPSSFNCQILVRKQNENWANLRFFHHAEQFKLICKIHGYTHWCNFVL